MCMHDINQCVHTVMQLVHAHNQSAMAGAWEELRYSVHACMLLPYTHMHSCRNQQSLVIYRFSITIIVQCISTNVVH